MRLPERELTMNDQILTGKWKELKGELRSKLGKIVGSDLEQTKGNLTAIAGVLQQKFGEAREEIALKLDELAERATNSTQRKVDEVTAAAADKSEKVKKSLQDNDTEV